MADLLSPVTIMQNETLLGSWDYARLKGSMLTHGGANLTVTNMRVINRVETGEAITRTELPVSEIKTIDGVYKGKRRVVLLIIALILIAAGIALPLTLTSLGNARFALFAIAAVGLIFFMAWACCKKKTFSLVITSSLSEKSMVVGRSSLATRKKGVVNTKHLKMVYNEEAAKSILDHIGLLVYSQQK